MVRKIALGCVLPIVVLGLVGWWWVRRAIATEPQPVRYETVDVGDVEIRVTETGTIEPVKKVEVKSKVAGRIARLLVQEGSRVSVGDLLAEIDPTEINSQAAQVQAQLDGARARLEQARRGVSYQEQQTSTTIKQYEEAVRAAEARLRAAQEESRTQPALSESDIQQAQASLQSARDAQELLEKSTHPQSLVQAQTSLAEAQAAADTARRNLDRQKNLLERGFVSEQVVDAARTELASAEARLEQARKRQELIVEQNRLELANARNRVKEAEAFLARAQAARTTVRVRELDVASAQAALDQARAQLAAARAGIQQNAMRRDEVDQARSAVVQIENQLKEFAVRQGDTNLLAPMSGVVTKRYIEQGELVTSGVSTFSTGTPVLQIADLSRMLVKMTVNEVDVHKIKLGLPVEINIDGARGAVFRGHVRKVAPAALDAGPGGGAQGAGVIRFAVEVEIDKPDIRLRPGMSARCRIIIDRRSGVLRVPVACVQGAGAERTVQLVVTPAGKDGSGEKTEARKIKVGLAGDTHVEVLSGLQRGDKLKPQPFTGPKRQGVEIRMGEDNRRSEER
jgi:HlyD family secretion protein